MDFAFTPEQQFFRRSVREAVDRLVRDKHAAGLKTGGFPRKKWEDFARLGYLGARYPERYGGMDLDVVTSMILFEEVARGSIGFSMNVMMQALMGTHLVFAYGTEEIKERVLVPALRGEKIGTICFTEERSGSDPDSIKTTASRVDGGWVIDGRKLWVTSGPICDFCTVVASTDFAKGPDGLSFFLVEKGTSGFTVGQSIEKLGVHDSVTGELVFDKVLVPEENLLGDGPGQGMRYAAGVLNEARVATALSACALADEAMKDARDFAVNREAFGRPISAFQLIRAKFAEHWIGYEAARLLAYKAAWLIAQGSECTAQCAMAKIYAAEMCQSAVDQAGRIYGGNSYALEYRQQQYLRDARFFLFGAGCHEVLRDSLGAQYLAGGSSQ